MATKSGDRMVFHQAATQSQIRKESNKMMFAKEAEALAFAEPLVPKRYHTWLRIHTQWKNEKERNGDPDHWVKYFCPYFTTEGQLRQAWDDARRVGGADARKLMRIVTAWHVEGPYLVWSAEVETPLGSATGHATANLGDGAKGVDAKNPFENGETSAIGRALRHLGYGFGFEMNDEDFLPESNGDADRSAGVSENVLGAQKPGNGHTSKPNGSSSNGGGGDPSGVSGQAQPPAEASKARTRGGNGHPWVAEFNPLLNEVLSLARRLSGVSKREICEIVSWASEGVFQYSDIGRLTPADLPKLKAAVERLKNVANEPKPSRGGDMRRIELVTLALLKPRWHMD
jgi:hypothetical protein